MNHSLPNDSFAVSLWDPLARPHNAVVARARFMPLDTEACASKMTKVKTNDKDPRELVFL
jgi:hypothetical protein